MNAAEVDQRVKYFREKRDMTRNKLATKAGVSPTYIYQVESGEKCPTIEYLSYLCFGLEITLLDFFDCETESTGDKELYRKIKDLTAEEKQALLTLLNRK